MARITFKDKPDFTGQIGVTVFSKGVGETDNEGMLAYFRKHGDQFEVEGDEPAEDEGQKLTPKQALQAELEALGLPADGKVDELKARLEEAKAAQAEAPKDGDPAGTMTDAEQVALDAAQAAPANGEAD